MNAQQQLLLKEAVASLEAARLLRKGEFYGFSASRAYYAMFYATEAILLSKNLTFSKHAGVISAFGKHFVKSGAAGPEYHRYLIEGMELRHVGDYGHSFEITAEQSDHQIRHAEKFIELVEKLLD